MEERNALGCYALRTKHGKSLVELKKKIPTIKELQAITISKPSAYGEYAPYTFADSEEELLALVDEIK